MTKLIIDVNEITNKKLVGELKKMGFKLVKQKLDSGDFFIPPNHIIERKEYSDFISSSKNRGGLRIFEQLRRMKEKKDEGYTTTLLIEGDEGTALSKKSKRTNLSFKAAFNQMQGLKLAIVLEYEIQMLTTPSMAGTAYILKRWVEKSDNGESMRIPLRSSVPNSRPTKEKVKYILEGFPFIGPRTADNIGDSYDTIMNFFMDCISHPNNVVKKVKRINKQIPLEVRSILVQNMRGRD